jgi:hypothetical protein
MMTDLPHNYMLKMFAGREIKKTFSRDQNTRPLWQTFPQVSISWNLEF